MMRLRDFKTCPLWDARGQRMRICTDVVRQDRDARRGIGIVEVEFHGLTGLRLGPMLWVLDKEIAITPWPPA